MRNKIACYAINDAGEFDVFIGLDSNVVFKTFPTAKAAIDFVTCYNSKLAN